MSTASLKPILPTDAAFEGGTFELTYTETPASDGAFAGDPVTVTLGPDTLISAEVGSSFKYTSKFTDRDGTAWLPSAETTLKVPGQTPVVKFEVASVTGEPTETPTTPVIPIEAVPGDETNPAPV